MDDFSLLKDDFFHLARLAAATGSPDIQLLLRRLVRKHQATSTEFSNSLQSILNEAPTIRSSPLRQSNDPIPVDLDSRLDLIRLEEKPQLECEPVLPKTVSDAFLQIVAERLHPERLNNAGLKPTRSVLFTGPPGVGKTLGAKWLARRLDLPFMTLDLSAVMSSFLGRTGTNVRYVLDYAKRQPCILLLDEFDAIAKRRDDASEIGELKRLVTVLLQEIDNWPESSILVAATNHPNLLDPAVWRRFDLTIEFPMPTAKEARIVISSLIGRHANSKDSYVELLTVLFADRSFSDINRIIQRALRAAAIENHSIEERIREIAKDEIANVPKKNRLPIAIQMIEAGISQRDTHDLTGISRDTIRKHLRTSTQICEQK